MAKLHPNPPSGVRAASMKSTTMKDVWPTSWNNPDEAPSGVGAAISEAYCMPTGIAPVSRNPTTNEHTPTTTRVRFGSTNAAISGAEMIIGIAVHGTRRPVRSDAAPSARAPSTPPTSSASSTISAASSPSPIAVTIWSAHVESPLNTPRATNRAARNTWNGRWASAWRSPPSSSARASVASAMLRSASRANATYSAADTVAAPA